MVLSLQTYLPRIMFLRFVAYTNGVHSPDLVVENNFEETASVRGHTKRDDVFAFAVIPERSKLQSM